jgi:hypothetical protein
MRKNHFLEGENINYFLALFWGLIASCSSLLVWTILSIANQNRSDYIAVFAGWLIGIAVTRGPGQKRSHLLQLLSFCLMIATLVYIEIFFLRSRFEQLFSVPLFFFWGIGILESFVIPAPKKINKQD